MSALKSKAKSARPWWLNGLGNNIFNAAPKTTCHPQASQGPLMKS
jgi:hypothetical protein